MFEDLPPPAEYVRRRLTPPQMERLLRIQHDDATVNRWFADHSGPVRGCPRHAPGSLPRGGPPGGHIHLMAQDGIEDLNESDRKFLADYQAKVSEEVVRREKAIAEATRKNREFNAQQEHRSDIAGIASGHGNVHRGGDQLHLHGVRCTSGCEAQPFCEHNLTSVSAADAEKLRHEAKLKKIVAGIEAGGIDAYLYDATLDVQAARRA